MKRLIIFLFFLPLVSSGLKAQVQKTGISPQVPPIYFNHLNKENGLPSNTVFCAIQDFQGYIWIGTTNGLARYDGHDVKIFRSLPGDSTSIVDNRIYGLYQTSDSLIWIGTDNGLSIYDPLTRTLKNFPFDVTKKGGFPCRVIISFYEDKNGAVWIATDHGLLYTDRRGNHFDQFLLTNCTNPREHEYYYNIVLSIIHDPRNPGALLLGTNAGLVRFNLKKKTIDRKYDCPPKLDMYVKEMHLDSNMQIWACGWGVGVGCFDLRTERWKIYTPFDRVITSLKITPKNENEFWVATDVMGLGVFNKQTHTFSFYRADAGNPRSLSSDHLLGVSYFNNGQDLWVWGDGIDIENKEFCSFKQQKVPYKLAGINDFFLDPDSGNLFLGGSQCKGIPVYETRTKTWRLVRCDQPLSQDGLSVNQFYLDSQKRLWVSTRNNLCYYDPVTDILKIFRTPDGNPLKLSETKVVYALQEDADKNLWVGTRYDGVIRIDKSRKNVTYFKHIPDDNKSLIEGSHFLSIQTDPLKRVWFGCRFGVSIYDPVKNVFDNTLIDTLRKYGINKKWVNGMEKDSLGRIWLAIDGTGLVRVNVSPNGSFGIKLFHTGNGMNDQLTAGIFKDNDANFWVINNGLLYVDPYREQFRVIDNQNGLHEMPGNSCRIYFDKSGNIYSGDSAGYETKNIRDFRETRKNLMNLVLESLEINSKVSKVKISGKCPGELNLSADQNNLTFRYTLICFNHTGQTHYRYRLKGYDRDWINGETSREARYTNLPPGKYEFIISATLGQGWLDGHESIQFMITPFFWQTWWFIAVCLIASAVVITLIYRYRLNQLLKVERLRTHIATDLHDDVSSTLSSISILSSILSERANDPKSTEMLWEIGTNSRNMLERIDDIIWVVNPKNDRFQDLNLRIQEYAIPLFESKGIVFQIDIPESLSKVKISMEVRRNIYLIAKEAVNNLVKYAECTEASIVFKEEQPWLTLEIADNGKGFDTKAGSSRNGIRNMHLRAEKINALLNVFSAAGKGTRISLKIKIM